MIRKLIISAAILTALIVSKETHAAGVAGLARDLATSPAVTLQAADWDLSQQSDTGSLDVPQIDGMTTGNVADDAFDAEIATGQDGSGSMGGMGELRLPYAMTLFHPF